MEKGKFVVVSVYVLHETSHWEVSRRSRAVEVKDNSNVLKSVMHVQSSENVRRFPPVRLGYVTQVN